MFLFATLFVVFLVAMLAFGVWAGIDLDGFPGVAALFLLVPAVGAGGLTVSLSEADRTFIALCAGAIVVAIVVAAFLLRGSRAPRESAKPPAKEE